MVENILPTFLVLAAGALAHRWGLLPPSSAEGLNRLTAYVALPALLVLKIGTSPLVGGFSVMLSLVAVGLVVAAAPLSFVFARILHLPPSQKGVFSQAVFRGNLAYMAFPVIFASLGEAGLRKAALTAAALIPVMNFLAVTVLQLASGSQERWGKLALGVLTNPLVLSAFLGLFLSAFSWQPWGWLRNTLEILANFALPAALLALGAQLEISTFAEVQWPLLWACLGKLLFLPAAGFLLLKVSGVQALDLQVGVLLLASPTAVASYPVAVALGGDRRLAGSAVLVSTLLAFPSYVLWGLLCGVG
ncbi:MAG: AEC family transporter [Thermoanaerobaculaceae bacterium]